MINRNQYGNILTLIICVCWQPIGFSAGSGVFTTINEQLEQSLEWGNHHKEALLLVSCGTHMPSILTTDSNNIKTIKGAALLAIMATQAKILIELFKPSTKCLAKHCLYDGPKIMLYTIACYYDYVRLTSTKKVLPKDTNVTRRLFLKKIIQLLQLGLEMFLRTIAYIDSPSISASDSKNITAYYITELADWVEIWRLLSRFSTLSDQEVVVNNSLTKIKEILLTFYLNFSEVINIHAPIEQIKLPASNPLLP
jgi:hypothetical protein